MPSVRSVILQTADARKQRTFLGPVRLTISDCASGAPAYKMGPEEGSLMADSGFGVCTRCGKESNGRTQLMIYGIVPKKDFYCWRCIRNMRLYAIVMCLLLPAAYLALNLVLHAILVGPASDG
jgi:hypothetical protein